MVIDATSLGWTTDDLSRRVTHLDVGVLCGDAKEKVVVYNYDRDRLGSTVVWIKP